MAESLIIANAALTHLGSTLITSLSATDREARLCNERIAKCRKSVLRTHPWNFAIKRIKLTTTYGVITGAVNNGAGLIRITQATHGYATGDTVRIDQVVGTVEANSTWVITVITSSTFDLVSSTFTTTYVSDGRSLKVPAFGWDYRYAAPTDLLRLIAVNDNDGTQYEFEDCLILTNSDSLEIRYLYDVTDEAHWDDLFAQAFGLYLAWDMAQVLTQSEQKREQLLMEFKQVLGRARFVDATENPARSLIADEFTNAHDNRLNRFVRDPGT